MELFLILKLRTYAKLNFEIDLFLNRINLCTYAKLMFFNRTLYNIETVFLW